MRPSHFDRSVGSIADSTLEHSKCSIKATRLSRAMDNLEESQSERIAQEIYAALRQLGYSDLRRIKCTVVDGDVQLHGELRSFYLKQLAQTAAMQTDGVRLLTNTIRVTPTS
jgi:osmotically-inducible protein OsmY